jgi:dihydrodipicolinate synthase/N-acetylneuraminate lyase
VPILVHVGANTTREARTLAEHAADSGADAVVAIPPIFYPIPDEALLAYFKGLADVTPQLPFLVYDIPHMAINGISPALLRRLMEAIPNFAGVKSSHGDAQMVRRLIDAAGEEAMVLAGNERIALGSLGLGGTGLISGLATAVPEPFVAMMRAYAANDLPAARVEQRRINQLLDLIPSDVRIGAIKAILQQRGVAVGPAVPPRPMPRDDALWEKMQALL